MIDHWGRLRATVFVLTGALLFLPSLSYAQGSAQSFRSERLYQQACDGGYMVACNVFGLMNEYGESVPQDLARAVSLYQRACKGGELVGCTNLGLMYEAGLGVPQDTARAVGLYRVAGLRMRADALNPNRVSAESRRSISFSGGGCILPVYVDGVEQSDSDLNQLPVDWIEAMEVYHGGATMPVQYSSSRNSCGVVLIWTRR